MRSHERSTRCTAPRLPPPAHQSHGVLSDHHNTHSTHLGSLRSPGHLVPWPSSTSALRRGPLCRLRRWRCRRGHATLCSQGVKLHQRVSSSGALRSDGQHCSAGSPPSAFNRMAARGIAWSRTICAGNMFSSHDVPAHWLPAVCLADVSAAARLPEVLNSRLGNVRGKLSTTASDVAEQP